MFEFLLKLKMQKINLANIDHTNGGFNTSRGFSFSSWIVDIYYSIGKIANVLI